MPETFDKPPPRATPPPRAAPPASALPEGEKPEGEKPMQPIPVEERIAALDWSALETQLWEFGHARTAPLLTPAECAALAALHSQDGLFRSRIQMQRHAYGVGNYAYFAYPLPPLVQTLREALYARLAAPASAWQQALGLSLPGASAYPPTLGEYLKRCHAAGQQRPTPLLLHYETGGYNHLHQDRYGELLFPFQALFLLSAPQSGADTEQPTRISGNPGVASHVSFSGGAFVLVEQVPRRQSRAEVIHPDQGEALIFPSALRPIPGKRGWRRAQLRHGVSRVTAGSRHTLGVIFHDAQ